MCRMWEYGGLHPAGISKGGKSMRCIRLFCKGKELGKVVKIIVFIKHGIGAVHELGKIYAN